MLRNSWTKEKLAEIFSEVLRNSETRVRLKTLSEAERFRFACYNFRRRSGIGAELSFILDPASCEVTIKRTPIAELEVIPNG